MLQRLYVNNFRCLENFELTMKEMSSALLIGKNGVGKSTIAKALEILQAIARGTNRLRDLAKEPRLIGTNDFAHGKSDVPIRLEIEVLLDNKLHKYVLALDLPENFKELRVFEEEFLVAGNPIYSRKADEVTIHHNAQNQEAQFSVDWHLIAMPIISNNSVDVFKNWLCQMIILVPIPSLMTGNSYSETLEPKRDGSNIGEWLSGILGRYPAAYREIDKYLRDIMPDFQDFVNEIIGKDLKSLVVRFEKNKATLNVDFQDLSDGEKCFFLCAVVLAANKFYGPIFCFWDEPDNYLSLSVVGDFIMSLRRSFKDNGQIVVTSHNPEAIREFSYENTFFLDRKSHLEPTLIRSLSDINTTGDLINALICGDIEL
ncbi:AAA family ATPase [Dolichospermum sp. LEGE 00240]|jgi:predicted ATPase|uniref:AAA family ATPase n=1 Tax=Dolichospermum sp. LEGE 00240 TaxID=1828603 RepID=UPI001881D9B6|nr:AAA family ATPase [Dolichospermum sp. LEGE 00240]MBE9248323.1 AAA family ATPase [Dolichospermum sp. LEGE 00240]MDM3845828.1 AAA family ATPase [Aphanizomenon gracile PMC638.10]MDM3852376.1 AAA family ATPase [Aphanizomenon gracile PMC627.10]